MLIKVGVKAEVNRGVKVNGQCHPEGHIDDNGAKEMWLNRQKQSRPRSRDVFVFVLGQLYCALGSHICTSQLYINHCTQGY